MQLELLAPARNSDIGIAAINCGADAVYIAGDAFGAREAASNPVADIERLATYAHGFGAKVYVVVNTILTDGELQRARDLLWQAAEAGADAFIVQDMAILRMDRPPLPLFASTQTAIRTPEAARRLESLGFRRLILERQLSLEQIRAIRAATQCELEFFVHGALCVCYSGQCYLSQALTGRSANRGACSQPCRSLYDLSDASGKVLMRSAPLLSLKDLRADDSLEALVDAGISSFKIEGRLKNGSYVSNVVRHYRNRLDALIASREGLEKGSFGTLVGGFLPDIELTFNRGYCSALLSGEDTGWNSAVSARSMGQYIGTVRSVGRGSLVIDTAEGLSNGDGLAFVGGRGRITGQRADRCQGGQVWVKDTTDIRPGDKVYRNFNIKFERELEKNPPKRMMAVGVEYETVGGTTTLTARCENGAVAALSFPEEAMAAENPAIVEGSLAKLLSKASGRYRFRLSAYRADTAYFYPASQVNGWRRTLAEMLDENGAGARAATSPCSEPGIAADPPFAPEQSYLANCANHLAREVMMQGGASEVAPAYELEPVAGAKLMRSRYCIRRELGICPKRGAKGQSSAPLYLINAGYRLRLEFDCARCEMTVSLAQ